MKMMRTDMLWNLVQEVRGGQLLLADVQANVAPNVFEKLTFILGNSQKQNVSNFIKASKGEWPT
jgi:hypothetical protein